MDDHDTNDDVPQLSFDNDNNDNTTVQQYHAELMDFLTNNPDMRTAAKHSLQHGLWAGGSAVAGGLLFGPVGGMVGGIAGSIIGFARSREQGNSSYDGIVQQLSKLHAVRRNRLVSAVWNIVQQQQQQQSTSTNTSTATLLSPERFRSVLVELAAQPRVREQIWRVCMDVVNDNTNDEYSSTSASVLTSE